LASNILSEGQVNKDRSQKEFIGATKQKDNEKWGKPRIDQIDDDDCDVKSKDNE